MPKVTKISAQVRRKDLVNIFLDGKYAFSVNIEDVFTKKIKLGDEISRSLITSLKKSKIDKNIFDLVFRFSTSRPHSEKEVIDYLKRKNQSEKETSRIIKKLKKLAVINDEAFTSWFLLSRQKANKGKKLIQMELVQKGVDKEIINKIVNASEVTEIDLAQKCLEKKIKNINLKDKIDFKVKNNLIRYLISRGFEYEISKKAIDLKLKKV
ncbi:RecX family transcriptional regulator [Candidatus Curtissbacteria bacterium]|nr:RecX family transcriptional regulator [Candidatus Curtissbacteria bacterium]